MSTVAPAGRKPWVAVGLSLFGTGVGHIYSGQFVKGLALFFASLLFVPLTIAAAFLGGSTAVLVGLIAALLAVVGIYVYAVVDAYRAARQAGDGYQLRDYNRGSVYVLFILLGLLYAAGSLQYLRATVFEAFYLPTESMAPTLVAGDHVLVNKITYQLRWPERGEVVVFRHPHNRQQNWIKRVVGLPGDTVEVKANEVFVNGKKLERERVPPASLFPLRDHVDGEVFEQILGGRRHLILLRPKAGEFADSPKVTVPAGACFVLGDALDNSSDSRDREFGFVSLGDVIGLVQHVYYPAETWTRFGAVGP